MAILDEKEKLLKTVYDDDHYRPNSHKEYVVYTRRWLMVLVVCLISMSNGMLWICFSPVTNYTSAYYNISNMAVNWLSLVYVVVSIPLGFVAAWLLDTLGLRTSIILAAWLNLIGSFLRNISTFDQISNTSRYPVLLTGQFLAACAQPFIIFVPTKLAALWFPDTQRAVANTLASMANPLGILVANLLSPRLVTSGNDLPKLLWVCTGSAGLGTILSIMCICSSLPPTPPSASAAEGTEPFFLGLKKLRKVKPYWILFLVFGAGLAIFTSITTFLEQILCPRGYSNEFSGLCGALLIACGAVGAIIAGAIVDKTKRFDEVVKTCFACALLGGILFTEFCRYRDLQVPIAVCIGVFGFFGFGSYPVCMEMAVEVTYPVAEATSSGLLFISGQIQSLVYMLVAQLITQPMPAAERDLPNSCSTGNSTDDSSSDDIQDWTVPNLFLNGVMTFFLIVLLLFFRPIYRRLLAEKIAEVNDVLNVTIEAEVPTS